MGPSRWLGGLFWGLLVPSRGSEAYLRAHPGGSGAYFGVFWDRPFGPMQGAQRPILGRLGPIQGASGGSVTYFGVHQG